ncbi:hypothetical protein M9Y48_13150 [Enterobacter cloacae subsp. cloacae]|uniref:hypothetical protein n=1 Tax=Enterobacter cloacae TaxID=550 RepID=UPI00202387D8|nr:hypothetical protein [Enterobacter cloacae]MCL8315532.1 hypothetical protein [Enterobacter cloacae subsp. cloacae]
MQLAKLWTTCDFFVLSSLCQGDYKKIKHMTSAKQRTDPWDALRRRREELAKRVAHMRGISPKPAKTRTKTSSKPLTATKSTYPLEPVVSLTHDAQIPLFKDDCLQPSSPSRALMKITDLYLHAAKYRSRHIALVWPASLKTLTVIHALATLVRWQQGDKQGIRGLLFPVKTNVFNCLNHIHYDRNNIVRIAKELAEATTNPRVKRSMPYKDAFFFSLNDHNLPSIPEIGLNPTIGELLPLFLATPNFKRWMSCHSQLLALIRKKLLKRAHANALKESNCSIIGDPQTAPDALFALDGRMTKTELRKACEALAKCGPPEVVMVHVSRSLRFEAPDWKAQLARFCLMLEDVFHSSPPGVVVIVDEPHVAYQLKDKLWELNNKREKANQWHTPHEFIISGIPSTEGGDGLEMDDRYKPEHPAPREFIINIVDAETAKIADKLVHIANTIPGGKKTGKPLIETSSFLSRLAALPCGVRHMSDYLSGPEISNRTRTTFDWLHYLGAVNEFERNIGVGEKLPLLKDCLDRGSQLFGKYYEATPFAHKLAYLASTMTGQKKKKVAIVFTNTLYLRLAERFFSEYDNYPEGVTYESFCEHVNLVSSVHLEDKLNDLKGAVIIFAGLNENCLRLVLTDDRIPHHSVILLTQQAGKFLRATLKPIIENMPEFKSYKPRMESILRQLHDLLGDASVLSTGSYVLPTFRIELSSDVLINNQEITPDYWAIQFDNGEIQYRYESSEIYVYEPSSTYASDAGFRVCQVRSLEAGNKVFIMSVEMREMVEKVLSDAGVSISSDKTFESALRSYHEQIQKRLELRFGQLKHSDMIRTIREEMIMLAPQLKSYLPSQQAMRRWINLKHSSETPFDQLRPQAPMREEVFKAFAQVLGFTSLEIAYHWQRVIVPIRNTRRLDGRHVSDIYSYMLLQPESVMCNSNIKRQTLARLFNQARANVATIERVYPLKEFKK